MGRTAFSQVDEFKPDNLIAGNTHPIDVKAVAIATGSATLKRGTLINATGAMCTAKADVPVGILTDEVVQSGTGTTNAVMYISGDFKASEIIVGSSVTVVDFELELQKLGIFLK